jgi:hypothetical protein
MNASGLMPPDIASQNRSTGLPEPHPDHAAAPQCDQSALDFSTDADNSSSEAGRVSQLAPALQCASPTVERRTDHSGPAGASTCICRSGIFALACSVRPLCDGACVGSSVYASRCTPFFIASRGDA